MVGCFKIRCIRFIPFFRCGTNWLHPFLRQQPSLAKVLQRSTWLHYRPLLHPCSSHQKMNLPRYSRVELWRCPSINWLPYSLEKTVISCHTLHPPLNLSTLKMVGCFKIRCIRFIPFFRCGTNWLHPFLRQQPSLAKVLQRSTWLHYRPLLHPCSSHQKMNLPRYSRVELWRCPSINWLPYSLEKTVISCHTLHPPLNLSMT